jgi:(p)ppGpp synthase/HD superfamily hydrolase
MTDRTNSKSDGWRRLADATKFALEIHSEQARKGTDIPYISHLFGVAGLVLEHGGSEDTAIAGLLDDAVEDQGTHQLDMIRDKFGDAVAEIVLGCTDADTLPKPPWRARKEAYIAHLAHASADILLVSCADKLHNARAICTDLRTHGLRVFDRFKGGRDGTVWYYTALAGAFENRMPSVISRELSAIVQEMAGLAAGKSEA